ncbi:hypothetical protein SAMN06295888_1453 [Desulfonatronum zhilinae]|nr:hypothetical protein SAMN06295888_1453 [Desulfonatronum zhilinae]
MSRFVNEDRLMQFAEMITYGRDAFLMEEEPKRVMQACKNLGLGPDSFEPALERALNEVMHKAQIVKTLFVFSEDMKTTFEQMKYLYEKEQTTVDEDVARLLCSMEAAQAAINDLQTDLQVALMDWVSDASKEITNEIQEGLA